MEIASKQACFVSAWHTEHQPLGSIGLKCLQVRQSCPCAAEIKEVRDDRLPNRVSDQDRLENQAVGL